MCCANRGWISRGMGARGAHASQRAFQSFAAQIHMEGAHTGAVGGISACAVPAFQRNNRKGITYGGTCRHDAATD